MRIELNDPGRCFGTNGNAVAKVVAALTKISGARSIISGKRAVKDVILLIEVGVDEWRTRIRIIDKRGRPIGYYIDGEFIGTLDNKLEII